MKYLTIIFAVTLLIGCNQTKEDTVSSKCRLKVPVLPEQCKEVGVRTQFGRLQGLPVTEPEGK